MPSARAALPAGAAAVLLLAGCGGGHAHRASTSPAGGPNSAVSIAATDRATCAQLFARLQQVTAAIDASSGLLTSSLNAQQLSNQIAVEQQQLGRSADLISSGPVPAGLAPATEDLAAALRAYSADFGRAKAPAARADFRAAVDAMTDKPVVGRILAAATTIEKSCR